MRGTHGDRLSSTRSSTDEDEESVGNKSQAPVTANMLAKTIFEWCSQNHRQIIEKGVVMRQFDLNAVLFQEVWKQLLQKRAVGPSIKRDVSDVDSCYIVRKVETIYRLNKVDAQEYMVFCRVEQHMEYGVTANSLKDLMLRDRIPKARTAKALISLVRSGLLREIRPITNKNSKAYISAEIEPATAVVGCIFYTNGVFEQEKVDALRRVVVRALHASRQLTFDALFDHCKSHEILEKMQKKDFRSVIRTLELDQVLWVKLQNETKIDSSRGDETVYGLLDWEPMSDIEDCVDRVPCFICPVEDRCIVGVDRSDNLDLDKNVISPITCPYMSNWLNML